MEKIMEKVRVYDENGKDTGKVIVRGEDLLGKGEYILAAVMIIRIGEKFLLTKRDVKKSFAGKWEFPGGAVQAEETSKEGGMRELKEETGIEVDEKKFNYLGQFICSSHIIMDVYDVEADENIKVQDIKLQVGETSEAKILLPDEINDMYSELTEFDQMIFDEFVVCMDEDYE